MGAVAGSSHLDPRAWGRNTFKAQLLWHISNKATPYLSQLVLTSGGPVFRDMSPWKPFFKPSYPFPSPHRLVTVSPIIQNPFNPTSKVSHSLSISTSNFKIQNPSFSWDSGQSLICNPLSNEKAYYILHITYCNILCKRLYYHSRGKDGDIMRKY